MMDPTKFTWAELADCAKREVGQRKWVYPPRVAAGKMRQDKADLETAMMAEIERRLRLVALRDAPDLFSL